MSELSARLREEISAAQERRGNLTIQKFTFVISAFGLGTLSTEAVVTWNLLFLAPIISLAFDLYIVGENFGIRLIGAFLGSELSSAVAEEKLWEAFITRHRAPFATVSGLFLSIIVLVASTILLFEQHNKNLYYWLWLVLSGILLIYVWWLSRRKNASVEAMKLTLQELTQRKLKEKLPDRSTTQKTDKGNQTS